MTAIEFLRRYRADDLVKSSARGEFELKSHDSFKINGESSLWHWKSRGIGGKSALDYLVHVEGCSFVEAVQLLCDEQPSFIPQRHEEVERKRPPFKLPEKSPTTTRVEAYLRCRGISQPVIQKCLDDGILYESLPYHNCVFVGRDENGIPRYAALRGTYTYGKQFKAESTGSDKRFGFCIEPSTESKTAAVFEAAIDAMAEMTLAGDAVTSTRPLRWKNFFAATRRWTASSSASTTTRPVAPRLWRWPGCTASNIRWRFVCRPSRALTMATWHKRRWNIAQRIKRKTVQERKTNSNTM